jgi:Tol biopolymer transport system component
MRRTACAFGSALTGVLLAASVDPQHGLAGQGPNGLIAYSSWDDAGNYDIYLNDPANPSSPPVRLTTDGRYNSNPTWSPDGRKIAYDGWKNSAGPRIRVMDIDPATDDSVVLTEPCSAAVGCYGDFQPAWSPDGTKIAFVSSRPNADGSEEWGYQIYVMDAMGEAGQLAKATRLTFDLPDAHGKIIANSQVTWSPDSKRIAFLSTGRGTNEDSCDLWVMDSQDADDDGFGDHLQRLTFDESFNCDAFEDQTPQWSPNSSLIAFTSVRSGYFDIWLVNGADPTDLRNVTQTPTGYEDQPDWSPDGTQIIFRGTANGAYEFFSLPVPPPSATQGSKVRARAAGSTSTPTQLTFDGKRKQQPDWGRPAQRKSATVTLKVSKPSGGRVTSRPAGIVCGRDCASTFVRGHVVELAAKPREGSRFVGWDGACAGQTTATCTLPMGSSKHVGATFQ